MYQEKCNAENHRECISNALSQAEATCRRKGRKLTKIRLKILQIIWQSHEPIKAYEILEKCRGEPFHSSPPTVYRAIHFLLETGLIHKIESSKAYVGCPNPVEEHRSQLFICEKCNHTFEFFENPNYLDSLRSIENQGFKIHRDLNEIYGFCRSCC